MALLEVLMLTLALAGALMGDVRMTLVASLVVLAGSPVAWLQVRYAYWQFRDPGRVVVTEDAITIHHHGLLVGPLLLGREQVHSVYTGLFGPERRGLLARMRLSNARTLPSLTGFGLADDVLVVIRPPLDLKSLVRWGSALRLARIDDRPTRGTTARGFTLDVADREIGRQAFSAWPTTSPIPEDVIAWVFPDAH